MKVEFCRQKKVRFPKGKKVKDAEEVAGIQGPDADGGPSNLPVPRRAAEERARRRVQMNNQIINEERDDNDIAAAEIAYQVWFLTTFCTLFVCLFCCDAFYFLADFFWV